MNSRAFQDRLQKRARKAGCTIGPGLAERLEQYFSLLARWNAKINLTAFALTDPKDEAFDRLLVEPVVAAQTLGTGPRSVIDIGSGSGSPAIPFHLAAPHTRFTMVEAKTRKAVFLLEAARHLKLDSVTVETARFEQLLARPELHEAFDTMTIRAVRVETATLVTLQAFLRAGGEFLWFQGGARSATPDHQSFPLVFSRTVPLIESSGSRLVVLSKQRAG